ncbi:MAG TPA: CpsD/CapB family tyrosine-protein kinase [Bryobacteraceae bacterium]
MSRVHDALRRAGQISGEPGLPSPNFHVSPAAAAAVADNADPVESFAGLLEQVEQVPLQSSAGSLLIDPNRPHEPPMEEFRTLRTRLNHLKSLQPLHSIVVTSPSPAEGKSLSAANLALAQSHLAGNNVLLADFDFRRPIIHSMFGLQRAPGITDYLVGKVPLRDAIRRIAGTSLYVMPAGEAVINPLELLNLKESKLLLDRLPGLFDWIILDSPPLLFAADANLLSTLCHGTLLVVRIGHTTVDSVARAMQSLCNNNVLGVVVNAARRGELYSKYTYYQNYYTPNEEEKEPVESASAEDSAPD